MLKEIHVISTPIGNIDDITIRALKQFQSSKVIIVKEYKVGKKLLNQLKINIEDKIILELNEHNEKKKATDIAQYLLTQEDVCLISNSGTPMISDPGYILLDQLKQFKINIVYYPGASSIIGSLITSVVKTNHFYYAGFLPILEKDRTHELKKLYKYKTTIIIMEIPYRLQTLLKSLKKSFGEKKKISICFSLTTPKERLFEGTLKDATRLFTQKNKLPFVLLIDNR